MASSHHNFGHHLIWREMTTELRWACGNGSMHARIRQAIRETGRHTVMVGCMAASRPPEKRPLQRKRRPDRERRRRFAATDLSRRQPHEDLMRCMHTRRHSGSGRHRSGPSALTVRVVSGVRGSLPSCTGGWLLARHLSTPAPVVPVKP